MRSVSRREALTVSALSAASLVLGARGADADAPVVRLAPRASAPHHLSVTTYGVTPDVAAVVAHLPSGELWAFCDGKVGIQRAAAGVVVAAVPVAHAAKSDITISVAGESDFTVGVDTRPDALRTSLLRVVNKRIALGEHDEPKKVVAAQGVMVDEQVAKPLAAMFAKARHDKTPLDAVSGHRAFTYQRTLYDAYKKRDGEHAADTYSARPGHSEHQLGLALDVRGADGKDALKPQFTNTPAGKWIAAHAHEFGFVVRYPQGQKAVTGYEPEPWHLRYVGTDVARFLHARTDIATLEQLLDLPDAPGY